MKIGIITFWNETVNYGAMLQTYALQAYLKQQGYDAFVIRHKYNPKLKFLNRLLRFLLRGRWLYSFEWHFKNKKLFNDAQEKAKSRRFDDFRRRYVKMSEQEYHSLQEIQKNPPQADVYITGSGVVWAGPLDPNTYGAIYFLNFGRSDIKRIAYAASFGGGNSLPFKNATLFYKLVTKFKKVSVREASGVKICADAGIKAVHCVDSTLLLDADVYKKMMTERKHQGEYAYFYLMSPTTDKEIYLRQLRDHFASIGIKSIVNTPNGYILAQEIFDEASYDYATVEEWLSNMYYAKTVLTSSFHGSVFSIIFHKNFVFLPSRGKQEVHNGRIIDLLALCGLSDRVAKSADDAIRLADTAIDYEHLKDKPLKELIRFSKDFLRLE